MVIERERKFLVIKEKLPTDFLAAMPGGKNIQTGYFTRGNVAIRVSRKNVGQPDEKCKVCFKGPGTEERQEFEYTIPNKDAEALIELAPDVPQEGAVRLRRVGGRLYRSLEVTQERGQGRQHDWRPERALGR